MGPTNRDILCGQSRICTRHPGYQTFQRILEGFANKYDSASSKQEKMGMTKEIVSVVHNSGGRFLKRNGDLWEEISTVAARDKVSHAFRTKKATWKRQHQHLLQQGGASNNNDNGSSHLHSHSTPFPSRKRNSIAQISIKVQRSRQQQQHKNTESVVPNLIKSQQKIFASLNIITNNKNTNTNSDGRVWISPCMIGHMVRDRLNTPLCILLYYMFFLFDDILPVTTRL